MARLLAAASLQVSHKRFSTSGIWSKGCGSLFSATSRALCKRIGRVQRMMAYVPASQKYFQYCTQRSDLLGIASNTVMHLCEWPIATASRNPKPTASGMISRYHGALADCLGFCEQALIALWTCCHIELGESMSAVLPAKRMRMTHWT